MDLMTRTLVRVRFSDVDSMGVVWHGHYIRYFEDGREDFGNKHNINYLDFFNRGILIPIVKIDCDYKRPLVYGDIVIVETTFINSEAAKILFNYQLFRKSDQELIATGSSMQVFLTPEGELLLTSPPFFTEWKKKYGLL